MVAAAVAALVGVPVVVQALPSATSRVSATTLLARIRASSDVPYSSYAQSTGGLALPAATGPFNLTDLFGGTSRLRVWQRDPQHWRVDTIDATGEHDLHRAQQGTVSWNYESTTAQAAPADAAPVRLPRSDDLVPANLARRLLADTRGSQLTRLADARIAGHDAAGLRVRVDDPRSTITRIDVWALPGDGLPVRVAVYGKDRAAFLSTTTYDLTLGAPSAATVGWRPAVGVRVERDPFPDVVSVVDRFGRSTPPASIAGLPRRAERGLGAVGVYGRGVEVLVAIPLPGRLADNVVSQLSATPGAVNDADGIAVAAGPIDVQLAQPSNERGSRWLLVGTLQAAALRTAVLSLPPVGGFGFGR